MGFFSNLFAKVESAVSAEGVKHVVHVLAHLIENHATETAAVLRGIGTAVAKGYPTWAPVVKAVEDAAPVVAAVEKVLP